MYPMCPIDPTLFQATLAARLRAGFLGRASFCGMHWEAPRRRHDRRASIQPIHLISAIRNPPFAIRHEGADHLLAVDIR